MLLCLLLILPAHSAAQRSEPVFSAITKTVLPPDYENNPTQLNYGVAVTDVDGNGDLEIFVARWDEWKSAQKICFDICNPFYNNDLLKKTPLLIRRTEIVSALQDNF